MDERSTAARDRLASEEWIDSTLTNGISLLISLSLSLFQSMLPILLHENIKTRSIILL